jgi:phage shock protein A
MFHRSSGPFGRLRNLFSGWMTSWVRDRESASPRAVYEQAIAERLRRYGELKEAVAGILYLRNKLEAEIRERRGDLLQVAADVQRAVRKGDDAAALALVAHRQELVGESERAERELEALRREAEAAKDNLIRFREEIGALEREKGRALAVLAGVQARRQVRAVLEGLSVEADVRALENLREHIARQASEVQLEHELDGIAPGADVRARIEAIRQEAREEAARRELDEWKQRLAAAAPQPELAEPARLARSA